MIDPYPGRRAEGPTLVWRGRPWRLGRELAAPAEAAQAPVLAAGDRRWIVAYGANASPQRLVAKGLDRAGALLLPAVIAGWDVRTEDRTTQRGDRPYTLVAAPGHVLATWVVGVHPMDLPVLDADEGRGERYIVGCVGAAAVAARWHLPRALAYGPGTATVLEGSPDLVPCLPEPVAEDWPPTPLEDLDLFVYGTLQPGHERWSIIADLVDVVGETTTAGTLTATPMRWPAAQFEEADGGRVHGTLLRARSAEAAVELYRRCDRVEDEGNLFSRTVVRTELGWAAAYAWHPSRGRPPGAPLADGRWSGPPDVPMGTA